MNGTYDAAAQSTDPVTDDEPAAHSSAFGRARNGTKVSHNCCSLRSSHIELPGLVWDLDRRIQFQNELEQWKSVSRSVILVDLPPACRCRKRCCWPKIYPQLIWLVDAGKSHARRNPRLHLETLRHARCKLMGAVLNREPEPLINL